MKNIFFVLVLLLSISIGHAQNNDRIFNPWKIDVSLGGAIPQGTGSKGGGLFAAEVKYAVVDQFWAGLRTEAAVMARAYQFSDGSTASANVSASASYLLTGDFYFTTTQFRPFIGGGAGLYRLASASVDGNGYGSDQIAAASKFGEMIRAGFELGHFRLGVEYNVIPNTSQQEVDYFNNTYNTVTTVYKNSYLGIKAGIVFGGRRL